MHLNIQIKSRLQSQEMIESGEGPQDKRTRTEGQNNSENNQIKNIMSQQLHKIQFYKIILKVMQHSCSTFQKIQTVFSRFHLKRPKL